MIVGKWRIQVVRFYPTGNRQREMRPGHCQLAGKALYR